MPAFDKYQVGGEQLNGGTMVGAARVLKLENYVSSGKGGLVRFHVAN